MLSSTKPRRILTEAGPRLTIERVIAFTEKLFGRPLTQVEIEEAKEMLPQIPEKQY